MDIRQKRITSKSPMHIVLVADDSTSMRGAPAAAATQAIHAWVNELYVKTRGKKPFFRFSLISFGSVASIAAEGLDVRDVDVQAFVLDGTSGTTNLAAALALAGELLARDGATGAHCPPFVFLFTDGRPSDESGRATPEVARATFAQATLLKSMPLPCGSPVVITLGFGSADDQLLTAIATAPALYHRLLDAHALISCLPDIGTPTVAEGDEGTVGAFVDRIMTGPAGSIRDR